MLAQNTHGRGLTIDFVGDTQVLSNIDSFKNITQIGEYWWEGALFHDRITIRLGKQDVNTEFLFMEIAADFTHSTFGLSPSAALPTYPDQSMAAVILAKLSDSVLLKFGIWDALTEGRDWGISGNNTIVAIGEVEYTYTMFDGTMGGKLDLGYLYESSGEVDGKPFSPVQEYYIQLQHFLFREESEDNIEKGLAIFGGYYPRFSGSLVLEESFGDSFVVGLVSKGLVPNRERDVFGSGVAWTELFQGGTNQETAIEFFYKAQITELVSIQPDVQYIVTPSGIERDAVVAGVRFQAAW